MYEQAAPLAFETIKLLLASPKDEVKLAAAKEIVNKVLPDKIDDNFAFLLKKDKEELLGIIAGSGAIEDLIKNFSRSNSPPQEIIDVTPGGVSSAGESESSVPGQ